MGWVLIGLGVILLLAGTSAAVGLVQYNSLLAERVAIEHRWDELLNALDRRHSLVLPLARLVGARVPQARPALEHLLAIRDEAGALRRLDQAPRRADSEERLDTGLSQVAAAVRSLPGLASDPQYRESTNQLDLARRRIGEAVTAFNLAVSSHRQRVSRGLARHVARFARLPGLSRFESTSRQTGPGLTLIESKPRQPEPGLTGVESTSRRAQPGAWRREQVARTDAAHHGEPGTRSPRPAPAGDDRETRPTFIGSFDPSFRLPEPVQPVAAPRDAATPVVPSQIRSAGAVSGVAAPLPEPPTRPTGRAANSPAREFNPPATSPLRGTPSAAPLGVLDFLRSGASHRRPPSPP